MEKLIIMKRWVLGLLLIMGVISLTTINAYTTENPDSVTFHSSMKKGAEIWWKLALFPAGGAPAPKLGNTDLSDGDLLRIKFTANPPTDYTTYAGEAPSNYNEFYLNGVKLNYNEIQSSLAMYILLYINPISYKFANGTTQTLREHLLQWDISAGNMVNVTALPEWSQAEIVMLLPHASLGTYIYTAQVDLNFGLLQGNHLNIQNNFEMMWTHHPSPSNTNTPGFELFPIAIGTMVIIFVLKKRRF